MQVHELRHMKEGMQQLGAELTPDMSHVLKRYGVCVCVRVFVCVCVCV
jgi:hypothetical protein